MGIKTLRWCKTNVCGREVIYNYTRRKDGLDYKCKVCGTLHNREEIKVKPCKSTKMRDSVKDFAKYLRSPEYQSKKQKERKLRVEFE